MNDILIEIGITPNRQDCLGVLGVARDLAAAGVGNLKNRDFKTEKGSFESPIKIEIQDNDICPAFAGSYIKNVKNIASPDWLQKKLKSIGLRPISALVDITNYVMFDQNRPLHVYDADKVKGKIVVRSAQDGESFKALDEKTYNLKKGMCTISDEEKVLGLGGIMGGESTGCNFNTINVLLESALFDSVNTARTGRDLSILSDARYRFERGIDPRSTLEGIHYATQLILEICGGECSEIVLAGQISETLNTIHISGKNIVKRLGLEITDDEIILILNSLGFEAKKSGENIHCTIPSWRQDIHGEADISEEIIRIKGYENIPTSNIRAISKVNKDILNSTQKIISKAKHFIASEGYNEFITFSFSDSKKSSFFGEVEKLKIINPISEDLNILRPSLIPNLLASIKKNTARGIDSLSIFEAGSQYSSTTPEDQINLICGMKYGLSNSKTWRSEKKEFDIFDTKNDLLNVINYLVPGNKKISISDEAPSWYHPGRSGKIILNKKIEIGYFGELHPRIANKFKIKSRVNLFELLIDNIPLNEKKTTNKPQLILSDFQSVTRDFAFILDKNIKSSDLIKAALNVDTKIIKSAEIFDLFEDKSLGDDKKSMAIKVVLQSEEKTLDENDINSLSSKIVEAIEKSTSGTVRS